MSLVSPIEAISQDTIEYIVQDVLDEILDDIDEANEVEASEDGGCVPSIYDNDAALKEEVAPYDEANLRQRIAAAITLLNEFCTSQSKTGARALEDDDAKSELDMTNSEESITPASTGSHSPLIFNAHESDTSYSDESSLEIEELKIEELALDGPTAAPQHFLGTDNATTYGDIPLEHLAHPEKYHNQFIEVKKSMLGGNGVFSKVDLKRGQLILVERPQIVTCPESLYNALDELTPEVRSAFLRMHAHKRHPDQDDRQAIFLTNAFAIQEYSCIYLIAARFNHTCQDVRSVEYRVAPGRVMEFRMMKDVPAGTELTISYGPLSPRQLYSMWGFRCACGGCTPISDEEVARIDGAVNAKGIW
ncbi:SET domain-containing protein [Annulohypoxylon truncatum]|uniref:SET domain-containing protein n=1 Tax=Annulohypoxylon truncatum TaxID=327061 RepID=UPI002008BE6B|nr:SET domain-containing protein [Annulohypoxylon truncatum]KAI1209183.1 SET domain-containing protein [Annulohypoxylon truncatum]